MSEKDMKCNYCNGSGFCMGICRKFGYEYSFRCNECESWLEFAHHKGDPVAISLSIPLWNSDLDDRFLRVPITQRGLTEKDKLQSKVLKKEKSNESYQRK